MEEVTVLREVVTAHRVDMETIAMVALLLQHHTRTHVALVATGASAAQTPTTQTLTGTTSSAMLPSASNNNNSLADTTLSLGAMDSPLLVHMALAQAAMEPTVTVS